MKIVHKRDQLALESFQYYVANNPIKLKLRRSAIENALPLFNNGVFSNVLPACLINNVFVIYFLPVQIELELLRLIVDYSPNN